MEEMGMKGYNIFLAGCTMCLVAMATKDIFRHFDIQDLPVIISAPIWLAGAIGLYRAKAWAWYASVLGVAIMFVESVALFVSGYALLPVATDPTDGIGYMLIFGFGGVLLSLPLLIAFFWKRKSLSKEQTSAESPKDNLE
ncbi:MAG: hypothetical protein A2283_15840 [Lentisphaerae bacterium RIFOXYA12_FULL_48_11]|nr:MAG: hypothetical protein A2283_15840 [Lentisphaerae bacterium RIFOXYA12_FULL_48_11]